MARYLLCGRYRLALTRPLVMGILNVTPDSFSDGGSFSCIEQALQYADRMVRDGAAIIDIGGESTRPNAPYVPVEQEMERVLPILERLQSLGVPLSIDTRRPQMMEQALRIGVDMINDVSALEEEGALSLVARSQVAVCLVHKQGEPDSMQISPTYKDVVAEVGDYLGCRMKACLSAGIAPERLLGDPGFGFGKTLTHNLALLRDLPGVGQRAGVPLLVGLSRKAMLGSLTGEASPRKRLGASIAAAVEAVRRGACIVRVHDVKETQQALQVMLAMQHDCF